MNHQSDVCSRKSFQEYITRGLLKIYGDTDSNRRNITNTLNRKYDLLMKDLLEISLSNLPHQYYPSDPDIKVFLINNYKEKWGRVTFNNELVWLNTPLTQIFFEVIRPGTPEIASAIRIRETTMDALMQYAIEQEDFKFMFNDLTGKDYFETPVNVENLRKELNQWEYELSQNPKITTQERNIANKLFNNIARSKAILSLVNTETNMLEQEVIFAESDRTYFKGVNLQNCTKQVRHAALGSCVLYDMRVGAFAVMAALAGSIARSIGQDFKCHNIKDYIKNRESIRMKVTKEVYPLQTRNFKKPEDYKKFFGFYNVKNALTAIGFGAKRNTKAKWKDANDKWQSTSLNVAFRDNKDEADRFLDSETIKELIKEYVECSELVLTYFQTNAEFKNLINLPEYVNERTKEKFSKGQVLAFIYQKFESHIMNAIMNKTDRNNILLPVHDGVYLRHSIDINSIHYELEIPFIDKIGKDFIQFEKTEYNRRTTGNTNEFIHKANIQYEEELAKNYISDFVETSQSIIQKSLSDEDYEYNRRLQFLRDVGEAPTPGIPIGTVFKDNNESYYYDKY